MKGYKSESELTRKLLTLTHAQEVLNKRLARLQADLDRIPSAPESIYEKIGALIRAKREHKNISQTSLASSCGLSRASIVNIEQGRQHCNMEILYRIATVLETPICELLP